MAELGLGRIIREDDNDLNFPIRALLPRRSQDFTPDQLRAVERGYRFWSAGDPFLNQGNTSGCVGFSIAQLRNAGKVTAKPRLTEGDALTIYQEALRIDEYHGEEDEGTSVRAGMKVLQRAGKIKGYRWAMTFQDVIDALMFEGPVIAGTWWTNKMFETDAKGFLRYNRTDRKVGGHAFLLYAVNFNKEEIWKKGSWGKGQLRNGVAKFRFDEFEKLWEDDGEVVVPEGEVP